MQVLSRPFAIEPVTNIMLPDGIFDNAIYNLRIACHYTNQSGNVLNNVEIHLESVGDPGIIPVAKTHHFPVIPAGATITVMWNANFKDAMPGKRLVSFIAKADGFSSSRSIKQIFVSQTRFNNTNNSYTCTIEEGTLTVSNLGGIKAKAPWLHDDKQRECQCDSWGPWIPTKMTMAWTPNPSYAGLHGDLPFSDPWWKILGLIVAIIAGLVAIIAAAMGAGTASFAASGKIDETQPSVTCCTPDVGAGPERDFTVAGVASAIATGAAAVALADDADPFWRGQIATPPGDAELTTSENTIAEWELDEPPNAGQPYRANVKWEYTRFTTAGSYSHSVEEIQTNIHVAGEPELELPPTVQALDPLWVRVKFPKTNSVLFKGAELYAFALFRSPGGLHFVVTLTDAGLDSDPQANDGIYAGTLNLEQAYRKLLKYKEGVLGLWRVYIYAQDVNLTKPGTPPEIAAQHIGGFFVASAVTITFDPSLPCPLKSTGAIMVV